MSDAGILLLEALGVVFVVGSMASMGFSLAPASITRSLRAWRLLLCVVAANFVVVPLLGIGLSYLVPLPPEARVGFAILALGAGAPVLPKLAQFAKGDLAFAVGLMAVLMGLSIIVLPIALPRLAPGTTVSAWEVAEPLVLLLLIPLGVALAIRARYPVFAAGASTVLNPATTIALIGFLLVFFLNYWADIATAFGNYVFLYAVFFVGLGLGAGYLLGGSEPAKRRVAALGTAQRNIAAGILVATASFPGVPLVTVTVLIVEIVGLVMLTAVSVTWGRRSGTPPRAGGFAQNPSQASVPD